MAKEPTNEQGAIRPWLLILLIIVALGAAGYLGWQYLNQKNTPTPIPVTPSTITTPSAPIPSTTVSPAATPSPTVSIIDDTAALLKVCQDKEIVTCFLKKIDGNFAYGDVYPGSAQHSYWYAMKTGNTWSIVADSQKDPVPPCAVVTGFPKTIVETCTK
jgi:hypothetical protein